MAYLRETTLADDLLIQAVGGSIFGSMKSKKLTTRDINMPTAETVKIGDREFTARTLTVKQIVDIFENPGKTKDLIDILFEDGIDSEVFYKSLGITLDDIGELSPEDIPQLMGAVAKVNPSWAEMEKRLRRIRKDMLKTLKGSPAA